MNNQWLTVREFAREMGRREVTVRKWLVDGTILDFGYNVFVVGRGRFNHRHYIRIP